MTSLARRTCVMATVESARASAVNDTRTRACSARVPRSQSHVLGALALTALLGASCQSGEVQDDSKSKPSATAAPSGAAGAAGAAAKSATPPDSDPNALPAPPDVAAPPPTAERTPSGLASVVLTPGGGGEKPALQDRVKVHYSGWTADGKMFDSSVVRNQPAEFGVTQVIKGWTEGLQLMTKGEKRRFWIPGDLAYDKNPRPGAPRGQLTFDVELIDIIKPPPPPEVPKDVAAAPASAKKTASGLRYRVLSPGTGKTRPTPQNRVKVHYTGWTPDGKMFDSSVMRGRPATFGVTQVIPGWVEGLQLMVEGEKTRFWIPSGLAYGDKPANPGAPAGPLVFDVELIEIL